MSRVKFLIRFFLRRSKQNKIADRKNSHQHEKTAYSTEEVSVSIGKVRGCTEKVCASAEKIATSTEKTADFAKKVCASTEKVMGCIAKVCDSAKKIAVGAKKLLPMQRKITNHEKKFPINPISQATVNSVKAGSPAYRRLGVALTDEILSTIIKDEWAALF